MYSDRYRQKKNNINSLTKASDDTNNNIKYFSRANPYQGRTLRDVIRTATNR